MKEVILITGACGEVGKSMTNFLSSNPDLEIIATGLTKSPTFASPSVKYYRGDITDPVLLTTILENHTVTSIFHFASILSSGCERNPSLGHKTNVEGGFNVLEFARKSSKKAKSRVKVIFPSTIAVYGLTPDQKKSPTKESEGLTPITIYGAMKIHMERLGDYFSTNYGMLVDPADRAFIDFRAVRFPGLLCSNTIPTGGTSDYGAEMLHAAAQGLAYNCFVRPDSILPFMTMPDAIRALIGLWQAPAESLTQRVYNVHGFSASAEELRLETLKHFPKAAIGFEVTPGRQQIVDSWPFAIDDSAARKDWDWNPKYNLEHAFAEYLVPGLQKFYGTSAQQEPGLNIEVSNVRRESTGIRSGSGGDQISGTVQTRTTH